MCSCVIFFALRYLGPEHRGHVVDLFTWLPSGGLRVQMGFLADPLSVAFILFITGVATLIHVFSIGYMHGDPRLLPAFLFAYMNLFVAAMLILVLGSSFLVTFLDGKASVSARTSSFRSGSSAPRRRQRGEEGVHHHPRRRRRLHGGDVPDL